MELLKYYAFDFDDNIMCLDTRILMDRFLDNGIWTPVDVSTKDFAEVRNRVDYRFRDNDSTKGFSNFKDNPDKNNFLEDLIDAMEKGNFGPSWNDFKECLIGGCLFAIITARGHSPETLRLGIEYIIDNGLTTHEQSMMYDNMKKYIGLFAQDKCDIDLEGIPSENNIISDYLDICEFHGVSHPMFGDTPTEVSKVNVLSVFKRKVNDLASQIDVKAMLGFSDDDKGNIELMLEFAENLHKYPNIIEFVIKDTSPTPTKFNFKNPT